MIQALIENGNAYEANGHVLFHVPSDPGYGKLSHRNRDEMIAGARVEVAPYKRDPADFVLWKPSEPELPRGQASRSPQRMTPLRLVIALLLHDPGLEPRLSLPDDIMQSSEPGMDLFRSVLQYIRSIESPTAGLLMHRLEAHEQLPILVKLASWEPAVSLDDEQRQQLFDDAVHSLQRDLYRRHSETLLARAEQRELTDEEKQQLNEFIKKSK